MVSTRELPDGINLVDVKEEGSDYDSQTGLGKVLQRYSIAQTEVTARQYCHYLNVVATGDNYLLFYNEKMGSDINVASIKREVFYGKNKYSVIQDTQEDRGNFPIVYVNLYQAARFCNWLHNQKTPGLTGDALTERGAYTLDSQSSGPIARNPEADFFLPTQDEWYKAAYSKVDGSGYLTYANGIDSHPSTSKTGKNSANYGSRTGPMNYKPPYLTAVDYFKQSVGPYNTYDMSGNVAEWIATEESQGSTPLKYIARGGSWKSSDYNELSKWSHPAYDPAQGYDNIGFRVASSLLVNSAPPDHAAPKETELTTTEKIAACFFALAGIAAIFNDCYRSRCTALKSQEAPKDDHQDNKTACNISNANHASGAQIIACSSKDGEWQYPAQTLMDSNHKNMLPVALNCLPFSLRVATQTIRSLVEQLHQLFSGTRDALNLRPTRPVPPLLRNHLATPLVQPHIPINPDRRMTPLKRTPTYHHPLSHDPLSHALLSRDLLSRDLLSRDHRWSARPDPSLHPNLPQHQQAGHCQPLDSQPRHVLNADPSANPPLGNRTETGNSSTVPASSKGQIQLVQTKSRLPAQREAIVNLLVETEMTFYDARKLTAKQQSNIEQDAAAMLEILHQELSRLPTENTMFLPSSPPFQMIMTHWKVSEQKKLKWYREQCNSENSIQRQREVEKQEYRLQCIQRIERSRQSAESTAANQEKVLQPAESTEAGQQELPQAEESTEAD